mmetsp:Transcript_38626/g.46758  ORF Transcript_38626/g.46758 Transcript_38626/m.46758 type:complete len:93 (+) Transcript_38626:108-386(+)|eukprot:CAMPEP_0197850500 /NCGR_PEP_ID=MMETSP1438-20131217/15539_1 /TAXON_ID=1461541 /ORGANISM="Pterosperma sp., Strain CCMP1384" /LENGTH=92 /DNA_ID=CAMNT_0043463691 /DNA_START=101 /DNA_END=379 /DNA_ORIENTATION=+
MVQASFMDKAVTVIKNLASGKDATIFLVNTGFSLLFMMACGLVFLFVQYSTIAAQMQEVVNAFAVCEERFQEIEAHIKLERSQEKPEPKKSK